MSVQELRDKSADALKKELGELLEERFKLRMQKGSGEMARSHEPKIVRRNIARVKTLLREKVSQS